MMKQATSTPLTFYLACRFVPTHTVVPLSLAIAAKAHRRQLLSRTFPGSETSANGEQDYCWLVVRIDETTNAGRKGSVKLGSGLAYNKPNKESKHRNYSFHFIEM
jgi:hypothetical protein